MIGPEQRRLAAATASLLVLLAAAAVPAAADRMDTTREASQGLGTGDALYFVVDYVESRPGRTLWFILPLRTGPHVRVHQVVLCRAVTGAAPEALAVLEEDRSTVLSRNHMFRRDGDRVVIAYSRLWDKERKTTTKEIFVWSPAESRLERTPAAGVESAFEGHFSGYKSPYTANPGITERSAFKDLLPLLPLPVAPR